MAQTAVPDPGSGRGHGSRLQFACGGLIEIKDAAASAVRSPFSGLEEFGDRAVESFRPIEIGNMPGTRKLHIARALQCLVELTHGRRGDAILLADEEEDRPLHARSR